MTLPLAAKSTAGRAIELGFELRGDLRPGLSDAELESFLDRLLDVMTARKLAFGGGAGRRDRFQGFVTRFGSGDATDEDRAALDAFLGGDEAVLRHEVGALRDAWQGLN